jgi:chemotaxis response regulator CheB
MNPGKDFPVACVGGSADAFDAYIRLLRNLPADLGVAVVIVNHLRSMDTLLHKILPHHTKMPVELITQGLTIRPNRVAAELDGRDRKLLRTHATSDQMALRRRAKGTVGIDPPSGGQVQTLAKSVGHEAALVRRP